MDFVDDLESKIREYLHDDYEITNAVKIPSVNDMTFVNKGKKMKLCTLCIDLRGSTDLMYKHGKIKSAQIHKAFLTIVARVIRDYQGQIRSFQGDSLLAFWSVNIKEDLSKPVKAAIIIQWLLDSKLSYIFERYTKLDFGIGLHWSEVCILRAGISRDSNNNDLIFIGESINLAVALANRSFGPHHISISDSVFRNLEFDIKNVKLLFIPLSRWERRIFIWQKKPVIYRVNSFKPDLKNVKN